MSLTKIRRALIVTIVAGLVLRLQPAIRGELWLDEVTSLTFSKLPFSELFFQTGGFWGYAHPPTYYILLKLWSLVSVDPLWLRTLSIIWYIPSAIILFILCSRLTGKIAAIVTVFIFSVHPLFVDLGFQVRMYSLALFFSLLSLLFFVQSQNKERWAALVKPSFFLLVAFSIDYSALWLGVVLFCASILRFLREGKLDRRLVIPIISTLLYEPQLRVLSTNLTKIHKTMGWLQFNPEAARATIGRLLGLGYFTTANATLGIFASMVVVVAGFMLSQKASRMFFFVSFLSILAGSVFFSRFFFPILLYRNIYILSLFIIIMIGDAIVRSFRRIRPLIFWSIYLLALCLTSVAMFDFDMGQGNRLLAEKILGAPSPIIVYVGETNDGALRYYLMQNKLYKPIVSYSIVSETEIDSVPFDGSQVFVFYSSPCSDKSPCDNRKTKIEEMCLEKHCALVQEL